MKLELRAMTNSQDKRDSAVMISSTRPSAKYSCSGSPDRLLNGRTAMEAFSRRTGSVLTAGAFDSDIIYTGMKSKDSILLQFWGTDFRRKVCGWDFWLKKIEKILTADSEKNFCLPDTRFVNEAKLIKSLGGYVWRVIRPDYNVTDRKTSHTSETELDSWDYDTVIINDGTIPDLHKKVDEEYSKLRGKNE